MIFLVCYSIPLQIYYKILEYASILLKNLYINEIFVLFTQKFVYLNFFVYLCTQFSFWKKANDKYLLKI